MGEGKKKEILPRLIGPVPVLVRSSTVAMYASHLKYAFRKVHYGHACSVTKQLVT
jgi:hypothetical protein